MNITHTNLSILITQEIQISVAEQYHFTHKIDEDKKIIQMINIVK